MNEKAIWDFLLQKTGNPYGTAAIMGNLMAESSMNPSKVTGSKDQDYVKKADAGTIDFAKDGHAFGLAQWCYHTRKQALMDLAKARGASVGNLSVQLEYLYQEMSQKYKSVWTAVTGATNIRTASDIVMLKYEKPAGTGESAKQKRATYGQKYFDQFVTGSQSRSQTKTAPSTQKTTGKKSVVANVNVNLRSGSSKAADKVGELKKGKSLEWLATENGWHKVAVWVSGEFVRTEG